MTKPSVVFFTICGGASRAYVEKEYNFLLGSIEHHAAMGRHVVLDNSPAEFAIKFPKLPDSVTWIHEPIYGHGKAVLRMKSAVRCASQIARSMNADVNVYTDCDEFWSENAVEDLWPIAKDLLCEVPTIHVDSQGKHFYFEHEWHRRAWPGKFGEVLFPVPNDPNFVGNPEDHPIANPLGLEICRVMTLVHHHMKCFIDGGGIWTNSKEIPAPIWPPKLRLWKDKGIPPLESFR